MSTIHKGTAPSSSSSSPTIRSYLQIAVIYPLSLFIASFCTVLFTPRESYFSYKRNIFNTLFVKYGWFWTTVVYIYHVSRLRRTSHLQAFARWFLATGWWILVTQWCFGPPIMDRMFLLTGGLCEVVNDPSIVDKSQLTTGELLVTSAACKLAKGNWRGGHDLSGHVFMLTHASLFLLSELLPIFYKGDFIHRQHWATYSVMGLLFLWWWMLVVTGVYFHTWREKLTGLVASTLEWGVVYVLAIREIPAVRETIGAPGL
ncbi:inositol phospholipid synthesis and fat-storage-inducing TM-domain-containing protein [Kalaharituber pfeilii]|nr:inositol phospholipid synthesis and fat-storage-inducing TM-domain-containing protein [Kalaharituber pfeilii]